MRLILVCVLAVVFCAGRVMMKWLYETVSETVWKG